MSQLTTATKVYRGISGGLLPPQFWTPNEYLVRGGVEWAFLSTTCDHSVAMDYASRNGGAGMVFEFVQGMYDRGAQLAWLSQYSFEQEILLPPLTGCAQYPQLHALTPLHST